MNEPAISIKNLSKKYVIRHKQDTANNSLREDIIHKLKNIGAGAPAYKSEDFWALKDVSFDVQQGDRVGVIGRNGAGKSTLLKILSRVTTPSAGEARFKGRVASLLEVGTGFHSELSGRENIYLNGSILGMSQAEIRSKFDEIVAFAEIEQFLDTPVKRYSSGMYVRLAFAIAAHLSSEILIVDEVLAVGDIAFQKKCFGKMDDASKSGRTIIFVSHDMHSIQNFCNKGVYLKQGQVAFSGDIAEAVHAYNNDTHANFFGTGRFTLENIERKGNLDVRFQSVDLTHISRAPDPVNVFRTGDTLDIKLELFCKKAMSDFNVAIIVQDMSRNRIIDANFGIQNTSLSMKEGERKYVTFRLNDVLLKPDEYVLGLWAGVPNIDLDSIEEAVRFRVDVPLSQKGLSKIYPGVYQCRYDISISD